MTEDEAMASGWKREQCFMCSGAGVVSDYGNGEDFYGPKECSSCRGSGSYWSTPKGRRVVYPGGPFC
jgi:DnaJ-class molecular chaperone